MARPTLLWNTVVPSKQIHLATSSSDLTPRSSYVGFDISNCVDWRTYTLWKAPDTGQQDIIINGIGAAVDTTAFPVDAIGICNHNLGTLGITVTVFSSPSTESPSWTQRAQFSPSDDTPIFETFTQQTVEYWRVTLSANGVEFPYMGLLYLGTKTTLTDNISPSIDPRVQEPLFNRIYRNEDGHTLPAAGRGLLREWQFQLEPVGSTKAVHASELDGIVTHVRKMRPFFFNFNPDDTIFENLVLRMGNGAIVRSFVSGSYARMGLSFPVVNAAPEDL